jgi:hypothetical protein
MDVKKFETVGPYIFKKDVVVKIKES